MKRYRLRLALPFIAALAIAAGLAVSSGPAPAGANDGFNRPGDVLIADQFNNRVVEVDSSGNIVWHFGNGPHDFSANSIIGVNDAQRVGSLTLMAGTGTPPGTIPECTDSNGCPDNRVILVDRHGHIVWQYGQFQVAGSGPNELNTPVQATYLPNDHVLITDQANERVIEVTKNHKIVWQYGMTGVSGDGVNQLRNPNSAQLLANGHILIADENNDRVIEVTREHTIVWQYPAVPNPALLSGAAFASRLPNGHTLITDSNNSRVIEVDSTGTVVWSYVTNAQLGSNPNPLPTRAIRLKDGHTLISDQFNHRVIEVDHAGSIVRQLGTLNVSGYDTHSAVQALYAPYDAKVVGDYTGLTPPNGFDGESSVGD
jgi:hypothetical protein